MANKITCDIVTPERKLYSETVYFVTAPAEQGEIGVLPMHEPFVSTLKAGEVRVTENEGDSSSRRFVIAGGYVQVKNDKVIILADHARDVFDIDLTAVQSRLDDCLAQLKDTPEDSERYAFLTEEKEWYEAQIRCVG